MRSTFGWLGFVGVVLASCATTRGYENEIRAWEGKPFEQLAAKWGAPASTSTLEDGGKIHYYHRKNRHGVLVRSTAHEGTLEPLLDCKTNVLTSPKGTVVGWRFEGPGCRR